MKIFGLNVIFAQRGATSLGFQVGRVELSLIYPKYWGRFRFVKTCRGWRIYDHPRLFRFKIWPKDHGVDYDPPPQHINCRCTIKPLDKEQ